MNVENEGNGGLTFLGGCRDKTLALFSNFSFVIWCKLATWLACTAIKTCVLFNPISPLEKKMLQQAQLQLSNKICIIIKPYFPTDQYCFDFYPGFKGTNNDFWTPGRETTTVKKWPNQFFCPDVTPNADGSNTTVFTISRSIVYYEPGGKGGGLSWPTES